MAEQALFNSDCQITPTEISSAIDLASHNFKYEDVVNMKDLTGLDRCSFSDIPDLGQTKLSIPEPQIPKPCKGKMVNFSDLFRDSGPINEGETGEAGQSPVPEKRYLRTRN